MRAMGLLCQRVMVVTVALVFLHLAATVAAAAASSEVEVLVFSEKTLDVGSTAAGVVVIPGVPNLRGSDITASGDLEQLRGTVCSP